MSYDFTYYRNHFYQKFDNILNVRFANIKPHNRRSAFVDEYDERYGGDSAHSIMSSVKSWFSEYRVPKLETLLRICNLLNCDVDYFLTDQLCFSRQIENAATTTGLKYETIEQIILYEKEIKTVLDMLARPSLFVDEEDLEDYSFDEGTDFLFQILNTVFYDISFSHYSELRIKDDVMGTILFAAETKDVAPMIHAHSTIKFAYILDQLRQIKEADRFPELVYKLIQKKKIELFSLGLEQYQVDHKIDQLRSDIIAEANKIYTTHKSRTPNQSSNPAMSNDHDES